MIGCYSSIWCAWGLQFMGFGSGLGVPLGIDLSAVHAHPLGRVHNVPFATQLSPHGNVHSLHTTQQSPWLVARRPLLVAFVSRTF